VTAKTATPAGSASNSQRGEGFIEFEDLQLMLRSLLADRFKLATHYEDRPVTAYTLVAAKPKLKPADPSRRTKCTTQNAPVSRDAPAVGPPPLQATCQNMTMAQFVEQLQDIAPAYIRHPVLDATGIEGAWDFTLTFDRRAPGAAGGRGGGGKESQAKGASRAGGAAPPGGNDGNAADPTGMPTLFEALSRQLGLKLEATKRPVPVLVIDHLEAKPTEN